MKKQVIAVFFIYLTLYNAESNTFSRGPGGKPIRYISGLWKPLPYETRPHHELKASRHWKPYELQKRKLIPVSAVYKNGALCDGKANLIADIGLVAILTGAVDTLLSFYSTNFTSVVSNIISVISGILGFAFGIPSAILTFLASSDRFSYTLGNVLSMLAFANTFYGIWSIEYGNRDILTSTISNGIGLFSLILSIATAYPSLIDETIDLIGSATGDRRSVNQFVKRYGCYNEPPLHITLNKMFIELL